MVSVHFLDQSAFVVVTGQLPGTLASYEADANGLTDWAVSLVPGLLQIEDYAMALMRSPSWITSPFPPGKVKLGSGRC